MEIELGWRKGGDRRGALSPADELGGSAQGQPPVTRLSPYLQQPRH